MNAVFAAVHVPNSKSVVDSNVHLLQQSQVHAKSKQPTIHPRVHPVVDSNHPVVHTVDSTHSKQYIRRQRVVTKQLQPCRKQHVSTTNQSLKYRRSLPNRSRVLFGITALSQQQTHQYHAYRVQNTIIDSYKVAMEVHQQHQYAAIDSGASGNFYPENYEGARHDLTADTIRVGCANKGVMELLAEDSIYFNKLPLTAKKCHKFKEIWLPLLYVPQLCKAKLTVTFKGETVEVSDNDGNVLITGFLDPVKGLFLVPIDDRATEQRVKEQETSMFAGTANQCIETDYNSIVRPILLTAEQHTVTNAYSIANIPALISYLHACAGFLVIAIWIYAINKGWYSTWPGLTSSQVRKRIDPSEHTSIRHMKMISKGTQSTCRFLSIVEEDEPEPHPEPITEPTSNIHDVFVHCFENLLYNDRNTIGVDLPGRYLDILFDGHKYIYIMHNTITNYINAKGLTSRRATELILGFEE